MRSIIESFAKNQQKQQQQRTKAVGSTNAPRSQLSEEELRDREVKRLIRQGSEAFQIKDYGQAVLYFTKALGMKPSSKLTKWLYKNRCVRCVCTYT